MGLLKKTGKALADIVPGIGRFTFDASLGTVFVTSGSGVIGYRVAKSLLAAGHESVRVGIWRGDREIGDQSMGQKCADELQALGAEVVDFDWSKEEDYASAVANVKTVFCTIPHMNGWQEAFPAFLQRCKKAKVEHFVKISFFQANDAEGDYQGVPFVKFHGMCDHLLELARTDSRISYTILRCTHFMSTPLIHQAPSLREEKKFVTASYGMGVNYVSPNDVADAAIAVLLNLKPHRNKSYDLTGPAPIKDSEVAGLLSDFFGMEIEHVALGYHEFREHMKQSGHPGWLIKDSAAFERIKASGIDEKARSYKPDLQKLIHRPPERFEQYLENKESMSPAWQWPTSDTNEKKFVRLTERNLRKAELI